MGELNHAIHRVEQRLGRIQAPTHRSASASMSSVKGGGRRSAGWTDAARAQVAERMRDYWRKWREERACALATAPAAQPQPKQSKPIKSRSTAGWTPQARAQAAARMRDRWHRYRVEEQGIPCD